jgi:hypothetical protein
VSTEGSPRIRLSVRVASRSYGRQYQARSSGIPKAAASPTAATTAPSATSRIEYSLWGAVVAAVGLAAPFGIPLLLA